MRVSSSNDSTRDDRQTLSCRWKELQSVPASSSGCPRTRFKHAACVVGNQVYICSGKDSTSPLKDIWRYHLGSGKWECLNYRGTTLPHLEGHTVVSYKRLLLIFGGEFSTGTTEPPLWILNIDQQHIHRPCGDNSMPQPTSRRDHTALVHCGILFIYGGFVDLRGSSSELWGYHIDEDYWKLYTPSSLDSPGGRHGHSCVMYRNAMWVFGGLCDLTIKAELWTYNFLSQKWQRIKCVPNPPPMMGHSADVVNDNMVVIGGENQGELYGDVWLYGFESNLWRKVSLHTSPHQPLPCSMHTSLCITKSNTNDSGAETSARCFSESALQAPAPNVVFSLSRPRTSPSTESAHISASKWVYPVKAASKNCDILSLELLSVNSSETQQVCDPVVRPANQVIRSHVMTVDDERPLLRFVSRDSNESVGIDNVVDCTADERSIGPEYHMPVNKLCSTTGLSEQTVRTPNAKEQYSFVNNLQHDFSVSIESGSAQNSSHGNAIRPNSVIPPSRTNQTNDNSTSGTTGGHLNSKQTLRSSPFDVTSSVSLPPTQYKMTPAPRPICSRYCDDLYIEDIEQDQNTSPVKVANPFTFTKDQLVRESGKTQGWLELESFKTSENNYNNEVPSSGLDFKPSSVQALHSLGMEFNSQNTASEETCFVKGDGIMADRQKGNYPVLKGSSELDYKKVLISVSTQTGSNLDLRPEPERNMKDDNSEIFFDGAPFVLVIGGKVNKSQVGQQPIKVWRCDINI